MVRRFPQRRWCSVTADDMLWSHGGSSRCWQPADDCIGRKVGDYCKAESAVARHPMPDDRALCCLCFVASSGHGFPPLGTEFIEGLCENVNLILQVPKQVLEGCPQFKNQIMRQIHGHKRNVCGFPETGDEGIRCRRQRPMPLAVCVWR